MKELSEFIIVTNLYNVTDMGKLKESWRTYLKKINIEYLQDMKNTLQKGTKMIQNNNKKYEVNERCYYDNENFDFSIINYIDTENIDIYYSNSSVPFFKNIEKIKEKFIRDADFIKKYNIVEWGIKW